MKDGVEIFAYEVNGFGDAKTYDDSNLPSLLSLPYMEFINVDDPLYQNTRSFLLSTKNIYFYQRGNISGIGSSHTPARNIWPLALIAQILTSKDDAEIKNCLASL